MELKKITPEQALQQLRTGGKVYIIHEADASVTVLDLLTQELAIEVTEDTPPNKPESGGAPGRNWTGERLRHCITQVGPIWRLRKR